MKRKVLIVTPHFPPVNAVDHQRVRMALPFLKEFGWEPTVLAVSAEQVEGSRDPLLMGTIPDEILVIKTGALSAEWLRRIGVSSLAYRALGHLRHVGDTILRSKPYDLIFFSTTLFPVMALGPRWRRRFGVPYVLDFQDPWLSDYYDLHPELEPPGGRLKYCLSQWLAQRLESPTVRAAAHLVCVSPAYPPMFLQRYSELSEDRFTTLPFGGEESDLAALPKLNVTQSLFDPKDGRLHWLYIGCAVEGMGFAVRAFFLALRRFLESRPELRVKLQVHFAGTDYAPRERARKTIEPIAREYGVDDVVSEQTDRLPYFEALKCLSDAHALFIPGSDDPGYTASKLYPYILARKPLLTVFHQASSVVETVRRTKAGVAVTFDDKPDLKQVSDEIYEKWFVQWPRSAPLTDWQAFEPYTARSMTRRLCEVFDRALANGNQH